MVIKEHETIGRGHTGSLPPDEVGTPAWRIQVLNKVGAIFEKLLRRTNHTKVTIEPVDATAPPETHDVFLSD